jgi:hypothetical protein
MSPSHCKKDWFTEPHCSENRFVSTDVYCSVDIINNGRRKRRVPECSRSYFCLVSINRDIAARVIMSEFRPTQHPRLFSHSSCAELAPTSQLAVRLSRHELRKGMFAVASHSKRKLKCSVSPREYKSRVLLPLRQGLENTFYPWTGWLCLK